MTNGAVVRARDLLCRAEERFRHPSRRENYYAFRRRTHWVGEVHETAGAEATPEALEVLWMLDSLDRATFTQ